MNATGHARPFPGPKPYQRQAALTLPILVRQARAGHDITYKNLARELGMPNPRNLNYVLGSVGFTLQRVERVLGFKIPPIQTIVVNQSTNLPGAGGQWFALGDRFEKFDEKTRRQMIHDRHKEVFRFGRWDDVLAHLGIAEADDASHAIVEAASRSAAGGGGESEEHRRLKEEVSRSPAIVGLSGVAGSTEKRLPSGDAVDVFFETGDLMMAVEVKSVISSEGDIARGLFQVVKYLAVMEATVAFQRTRQRVGGVLVLEGTLPRMLLPLRNTLGVRVIELGRC